MVSFFISDRIISQALAVIVLVGLIYVVLRELPELVTIIEDVLFLLTGEDHDLQQLIE
jgi:archaeosortase A (PGF-CTERM-specific)